MRVIIALTRSALCAVACVAFMAGCGGSRSSIVPPETFQTNGIDSRAGHDQRSAPLDDNGRSLLYVAAGSVEVYTYPRGKQLGSLGWGGYLCSDRFGNIIVAGAEGISYVWVFPHGGSNPIATLYNPESPGGCSVEQSSENIAVASADSGAVVVFPYNPKRGWRLAHDYHDPNMRGGQYCTYDPQGDIFVDGYDTNASFMLAELPKGSSTFTTITLDQVVHRPGSMQWYGKYLAIEDAGKTGSNPAVIYRYAISGSSGHRVSVTTLKDSVANGQFLIYNRTVIGPMKHNSVYGLGFWRFPSGGAPFRTISTYTIPGGEALSLK